SNGNVASTSSVPTTTNISGSGVNATKSKMSLKNSFSALNDDEDSEWQNTQQVLGVLNESDSDVDEVITFDDHGSPVFDSSPKLSNDAGSPSSGDAGKKHDEVLDKESRASNKLNYAFEKLNTEYPDDLKMPGLETNATYDDSEEEADFTNLESLIHVSPTPTIRTHKNHLLKQGKKAIGTKWVFRNKKDERGIVINNKARLVTQGHTQEEGIYYDEFFALVARIKAIRLFLAYALFMGFILYQMDVKSAFLYGRIEEAVYVCQPLGFEDPDHPDKVYKVVYVDDIIFGSTKKELCTEFERLMKDKFQMSSMGELTFFLGLQVKQKEDGIFISHDKYVTEVLRKFNFLDVKSASTPVDMEKTLVKDADGDDVGKLTTAIDVNVIEVTFLEKSIESKGFEQIIKFLNANPIKYVLTVNPMIYTLCIKQFWATSKVKAVNGEEQIQALVDQKKVIITETSVRSDLYLKDAEGTECLPTATIFEQRTLIGYENLTQKLTFYKAFFSPQWKFIIHTILQCLSAKTTPWNEFSRTMASAITCLATNQKLNFSKYIFDHMVKNLEGGVKFLMFLRFVQVIYVTPSHTKKIFANIERQGKDFSVKVTPLFETMMKQNSKKSKKKITKVPQLSDSTNSVADKHVTTTSNNPLLSGEDRLKLTELMELYTHLQSRVLALETTRSNQALEIRSLKRRVKRLEKKASKKTYKLKILFKIGSSTRVESFKDAGLGDQEDASKQGRMIFDLDTDEGEGSTADSVSTAGEVVSTADVETLLNNHQRLKIKAKAKMIELEKPMKRKDQIMIDEEVAINLEAQMHAGLEDQLKNKSFKEIQMLFNNTMKWIVSFVLMDTKLVKGNEKAAEGSSKRAGVKVEQEDAKRQRIEEENESVELKRCSEIIPDDNDDMTIKATHISSKTSTIVNYKIYKEGRKIFFKIIRVDDSNKEASGDTRFYEEGISLASTAGFRHRICWVLNISEGG
nr:hypothetical protein [Tanacetum cinerariifolium]